MLLIGFVRYVQAFSHTGLISQKIKCNVRTYSICLVYLILTRYLSDETLTSMRSSPIRTFSPSDLCLDAG